MPYSEPDQPDSPAVARKPPLAVPAHAAKPLSLRRSLVALVCVCVLPVAVAALYLVYLQYQQGWDRLRKDTVFEARHRAAVLDRKLESAMAGLKALATAPELAAGDLAAWQQRASAAVLTQDADNYVLTTPEGRQTVNTLRPFGSPLPADSTPMRHAELVTHRRVVVSDLFVDPVTQHSLMSIGLPVVQGGAVRYGLHIGMAPRYFQALLDAEKLPDGWVAAVLDSRGTIVARTREPLRFVGQRAVPDVVAQIAHGREGSIETMTVDGVPVVSSFSRSEISDWSVAVGAPRSVLQRHLVWSVAAATAGVLIAALLGFWLAQVIARRVTGAVQNLNTAARALVDGASFTLPRLQLKEAESVGQALQQASEILQRTRHAALHDPLTGLSNRARFLDLLHQQLENTSLRQQPFAVMMLDLDGLKRINDEAGHVTGDQALKATAQRIRATLPADGTAARLGGDEFGLLLPSADRAQAHATALRLLTALAEPDDLYPHPIAVGIGVALWPSAGRDATALIEAADNALYAAKRDDNGHLAFAPALPH